MKSRVAILLSAVSLAIAIPTQQIILPGNGVQAVEDAESKLLPTSWPGIDLNLDERRLVQLEGACSPVWMTELEKIVAKAAGTKFFDITEEDPEVFMNSFQAVTSKPFPAPNATEDVATVIGLLSTDGPQEDLATFTSFRTRYYRSDTGRESQKWLLGRISDITSQSSMNDEIDISEFHHSWGQHSIVAKIPGSASNGSIIISAHQDSTNMWPFLPAPGADDDGSGSVTILETYRALLEAEFQPKNDVEFHWYSAEEGGLLGSQAVAASYRKHNATVLAQIQFDMTAYVKAGTREEVGVITDFVDPNVVTFVKQLIDAYLDIPYVETKCGYACSDHASWTKNGYPSSFAIESSFENSNHDIHSTGDRLDIPGFSFDHMLEFSKLAAAFAVELGNFRP